MKRLPSFALLLLLGLLAGCSSYDARVSRLPAGLSRCFVLSNDNDNHGLDRQIVSALQARGYTADSGPLTMMPEDTQVILSFQDHWAWDFGDHLTYLQISARDRKSSEPLGNATFSAKLPTRTPTSGIVNELVTKLLPAAK